jgi:hypothetical protein
MEEKNSMLQRLENESKNCVNIKISQDSTLT